VISEARWEIGNLSKYSDTLRLIEADPYVFLSRTRFERCEFEFRHGDIVKVDRGVADDQRCVFCWYASCLDEDGKRCGHASCERGLRRSNMK
jgi:hypothetical protein